MGVQSQYNRIVAAKNDIKAALSEKGVTVADTDLIDSYADYVRSIETGGEELAVLQKMIKKQPTVLIARITNSTDMQNLSFMYPTGTEVISWGDGTTTIYDPSLWDNSMSVTHRYPRVGLFRILIYGATEIPPYFAAKYPPINANNWLTEIYMSNTITSIGEYAFYNASVLNKCVLSNYITALTSGYIFSLTPSLLEITIPESITSIYAMSDTSFQKVIFPHTTPPSIVNQMSATPFGANAKPIIPSADLKDTYFNKWYITVYWYTLTSS